MKPSLCQLARARARTLFCKIIHCFDVSIDSSAKTSTTFTRFLAGDIRVYPFEMSQDDNNQTCGARRGDGLVRVDTTKRV
jgi:hypothetical protein